MHVTLRRILIISALLFVAAPVLAVDSAPDKADALGPARAQIAEKKWDGAIAELKRVNATESADWNNLMGYSLRKRSAPDLAGSERYYDEALRLDPKHRGALEYSGELYLILGNLPKAEQRLATLDKVCVLPCEEYTDLKKSVARYKANGNKYVAAQ
jgi:Flp pilus assembly protein TadD